MTVFGVPVIVAVNHFPTDTQAEVEAVREVSLAAGARDGVVPEQAPALDGLAADEDHRGDLIPFEDGKRAAVEAAVAVVEGHEDRARRERALPGWIR